MSLLVLTIFFGLNIEYKYKIFGQSKVKSQWTHLYRSLCCQNYEIRNRDLNLYKYFLHNWLSFSSVIKRSIINQKFVKMTSISIKYKEKIRLSIDFMITCYIYSGSLHIRSYCVRSPWYWISVTRLVFYLYCVNFVIY